MSRAKCLANKTEKSIVGARGAMPRRIRYATVNRLTTVVLCAAIAAAAQGPWSMAEGQSSATADPTRIQRDIATLADDKWEGRGTCTPGLDSAAAYIARRFASLR